MAKHVSLGGKDGRSIGENVLGAAQILWALATPFLRRKVRLTAAANLQRFLAAR